MTMAGCRVTPATATVGVLLVLACLAWSHSGVEAIVCYDCNSEYDPRCGDPFDPYTLGQIDCNERPVLEHLGGANATICRKLVQKISNKIRVIRTCGYIEDSRDGGCVSRSGTHDVNVQYCSCKGNLCNASPPTAAPRLLLMLAPVLAILTQTVGGRS